MGSVGSVESVGKSTFVGVGVGVSRGRRTPRERAGRRSSWAELGIEGTLSLPIDDFVAYIGFPLVCRPLGDAASAMAD